MPPPKTVFGWSAAEALGRELGSLVQRPQSLFDTALNHLLQTGDWLAEVTVKNKAGEEIAVFSRWSLLRGRDGRPRAILSAHTDITEKKRLEATFLRAQRMDSIGALAGGIAHDL